MTMKIDSAALPATGSSSGSSGPEPLANEGFDDPAIASGEPRATRPGAGETTLQPPFAAVLADASAPAQTKVKSSLPLAGPPLFTLGLDAGNKSTIGVDGKKKGAPKAPPGPQKTGAEDATAVAIATLPIEQRPLGAISLALPSFEVGAPLTADASGRGAANDPGNGAAYAAELPFANGMALAFPNARAVGSADAAAPGAPSELPFGAADATGAANVRPGGELSGLDHVALSLEASARVDARNGFAASSGVHRTAKAIAEDQQRIGVSSLESVRTYAAIAKATSTTVTHMIHAAASSANEPHARTSGSAAVADSVAGTAGPHTAIGAMETGRSGGRGEGSSSGSGGGRGEPGEDQRAATAATKAEGSSAESITPPNAGPAHSGFSLPLPTHTGATAPGPQVTRPAELRAAFAEDLMSGVERAAASGRTDFEVRAFDGTRVAINVQMKDDKVHVGFAFDAKHTAAEATVRATLGSLETRLGERGLSTVVSFGTLQRSPHEVGVTAASNAGAGSNAMANGQGGNGKHNGDPRGEPQLAEVTELAARPRDARAPKVPAPTPNGRGGWVA
jgi:hypothetical protein